MLDHIARCAAGNVWASIQFILGTIVCSLHIVNFKSLWLIDFKYLFMKRPVTNNPTSTTYGSSPHLPSYSFSPHNIKTLTVMQKPILGFTHHSYLSLPHETTSPWSLSFSNWVSLFAVTKSVATSQPWHCGKSKEIVVDRRLRYRWGVGRRSLKGRKARTGIAVGSVQGMIRGRENAVGFWDDDSFYILSL